MKTHTTIPVGPVTAVGALIILVAVAAVWVGPGMGGPISPPPIGNDFILSGEAMIGKPLPTFTSEADIIAQFKAAQALGSGGSSFGRDVVLNEAMAPTASADGASGAKSESTGPSYSSTNNQVAGVDEADIVKTDGKYIYAFYKNNIKIIKAYPAENAEVVTTIPLGDVYPQDMFINGDQLIVFGTQSQYGGNYPSPYTKMSAGMYYPYYGYSLSVVRVYDLSSIETPDLVKEYSFHGSNVSSRMVEDTVYFVLTTYPEYRILSGEEGSQDASIIPPYYEDGEKRVLAIPTDIGYIPPVYAQNFITVASIDLDSLSLEKETMVGSAETVYASENNLYVAHTQYYDPADWPQILEKSTTSIAPLPYIQPQVKTVITKFALNEGKVSFSGQGKVMGRLLNQFSMDEWDNHFRVATTTDQVWSNEWNPTGSNKPIQEQSNHVYVLDEEMDVVGALEDLAPGEQIYSARFMGERAYLVTFKQVDPLFVLDLSNHEDPQVLGKLKIPGYSNYLHPLDETHILGIGKDAEVSKNDTAYYLGMKLAIFDVSDVENPKQIHSLVVGDRGTDSFALQDHKAFLYDAEKELLVLPIYLYEVDESQTTQPEWETWPAYGTPTFQGAFAWHVTLENGFEEIGKVTHIDEEIDLKSGYYYDYSYQVKRSLLIGDVLYTLSDKRLMANDLMDELKEIATVDFVNVPKTFSVISKVEGVFCAGPCGYQSVEINKTKIKTESYSGGENGYKNISEYPSQSQYEDLFELLDWDAFKQLDETLGCPGCADGSIETVTISDGTTTHTVKMEAGMKVEGLQQFFNTLRNYTGGGGIYYATDMVGAGTSSPPSVGTVDPVAIEG
jgi:uncharacterized secreted protein with C-terminal beta-propeller domain